MFATLRKLTLVPLLLFAHGASAAQYPAADYKPDAVVPSTPKTVIRGSISYENPPIAHIKDGDTVLIHTISHGGLNPDPVAFFTSQGIPAKDVLQDAIDIAAASRVEGWGGHVLTGPIYIDGAEPGDMLEVRVLKVTPRTYYGTNTAGPGGIAAGLLTKSEVKVIKFDVKRNVMMLTPEVEPRLGPFMGIMAVAPPPEVGKVPSGPPGTFGGNLDFRRLTAGATLYLPVYNKGALFVTGDSHAGQGDGEVSGNANEASMSPLLQFIVHKGGGKELRYPWAEDANNYYILGMDLDLDKANSIAVVETIQWLHKHKGLSLEDAYHLSSIGVDFAVAEAVDKMLVIYATIPKAYFKTKSPYWTK